MIKRCQIPHILWRIINIILLLVIANTCGLLYFFVEPNRTCSKCNYLTKPIKHDKVFLLRRYEQLWAIHY